MKLLKLHWLDLAEYIAILGLILSLLIYIFSQKIMGFLVLLTITLGLNLVNRKREKQQNYHFFLSYLKKSKSTEQPSQLIVKDNQVELNWLQESVQKITGYLQDNHVEARISKLEQLVNNIINQGNHPQRPRFKSQKSMTINTGFKPKPLFDMSPTPNNFANWELTQKITAHKEAIADLAITPDEKYVLSVSWDRNLKLWELATGELVDSIEAHSQGLLTVECSKKVKYTDTRYWLATGSFDQHIKLWSIGQDLKFKQEEVIAYHSGSIHDLAIASEAEILVSGSYDQTIKQWNLFTGAKISTSLDESGGIYALALYSNHAIIATGGGDGQVTLWQLESGDLLAQFLGNVSSVQSLAFSDDGELLAAGCVDGTIKLWQLNQSNLTENLEPIQVFDAHKAQVMSLAFHPSKPIFLSAGADGTIKSWHLDLEEPLSIITQESQSIFSILLNTNADLLVSGGVDGDLKIWRC